MLLGGNDGIISNDAVLLFCTLNVNLSLIDESFAAQGHTAVAVFFSAPFGQNVFLSIIIILHERLQCRFERFHSLDRT